MIPKGSQKQSKLNKKGAPKINAKTNIFESRPCVKPGGAQLPSNIQFKKA